MKSSVSGLCAFTPRVDLFRCFSHCPPRRTHIHDESGLKKLTKTAAAALLSTRPGRTHGGAAHSRPRRTRIRRGAEPGRAWRACPTGRRCPCSPAPAAAAAGPAGSWSAAPSPRRRSPRPAPPPLNPRWSPRTGRGKEEAPPGPGAEGIEVKSPRDLRSESSGPNAVYH